MIYDLIVQNRSYRRFEQEFGIARKTLEELIELARLSPSSGNKQPLKFMLSHLPERNSQIFPLLSWAAYLKDWPGPGEGERPSAYIVVLGDTLLSSSFGYDAGIAVRSILLGATEKGLGGCIIASVRKEEMRAAFMIPDHLEILLVVALGKPHEVIALETVGDDGNIRYWRDDEGVHHVPKRPLQELILS